MLGLLDREVNETSRVVVAKVIYSFEHHIVLTLAAGSTRQPSLSLTLTIIREQIKSMEKVVEFAYWVRQFTKLHQHGLPPLQRSRLTLSRRGRLDCTA